MMHTKLSMAVGVVCFCLLACWSVDAGNEKNEKQLKKPPYVHAVVFYLKKDAPKNETEASIRDAHDLLAKIPSVRGLWVGRPAEKSTPKFAVTDYDFGLLVLFDDFGGLQTYLDHPLHSEYLDKHAKHWDRVPVYDFVTQSK